MRLPCCCMLLMGETYFHLTLLLIFTGGLLFSLSNIAAETSTLEDLGQRGPVKNSVSSCPKSWRRFDDLQDCEVQRVG